MPFGAAEQHLMREQAIQSWSDAPVIIDAANVAASERLDGCGKFCWGRVTAVRNAWRSQIDPEAEFIVVMDTRPALHLGAHCKATYRGEVRNGFVTEVDFADPEILRLAEEHDAAVLTGDFFKDHRRTHPWLDGNTSQFFEWEADGSGARIFRRDMGNPSEFSKTRAEERAELKGRGVDITKPAVEGALRQRYRCPNEGCWLHQYDPGHYTGVPDLSLPNSPRCATCQQPLESLGDSTPLVQVKFSDLKRSKVHRLTLSPNFSLQIGRDSSPELVTSILGIQSDLISRNHALLEWDGALLTLTDLGSKNGTTLRIWSGKQRGYAAATAVYGSAVLRARDEARLADALVITRSARRFTLEPDRQPVAPHVVNAPTIAQERRRT